MLRSLFSAVSGLRDHQVRMDVIGNNVSNVNTVAFKAGRVTFKEGFAQLLQGASRPPGDQGGINPIQIGLGVQIGSIDTLFSQGNFETTGINTDLAITGDAFFVVSKGSQQFYTRSGNFQLDADGRLVCPTNGFVVQGRSAVNGEFVGGIGDIRLPFGQKTAPKATSRAALAGNLNASAPNFTGPFVSTDQSPPVVDSTAFNTAYGSFATIDTTGAPSGFYGFTQDASGNIQLYKNGIAVGSPQLGADGATLDFGDVSITLGSNWSTSPGFSSTYSSANDVTVMSTPTVTDAANKDSFIETSVTTFDGLGEKHELKIQLWKQSANTWGWRVDPTNLDATLSGTTSGQLTFDPNTGLMSAGASNPTITFTPVGSSAAPVSVTIDLGIGTVNGISQFAGTNTAVLRDQDGYTAGTLQSFSIDRTGTVTGSFTNGTTEPLAQIVLADFNNPSGLLRVGDNMYSTSGNSGGAVLGFALEGSQSSMTSGALEMSNVDLAQEFTNMIVAQRGFQANGRMITTSDEMLQELVNLKR
jgi:flagellar hook protein FlgE